MANYAELGQRYRASSGGRTAGSREYSDVARPASLGSAGSSGLATLQAMFDQSPRVRSMHALSRMLNSTLQMRPLRAAETSGQRSGLVVQRVVASKISDIRAYKAYRRLSLKERGRIDQVFFRILGPDKVPIRAASEEALIADLQTNVFRQPGAGLSAEPVGAFRKASFDDEKPLTIYRVVSAEELTGLQEKIGRGEGPVFEHKGGKEEGEKFFGTNKRYVWSQWANKGTRGKGMSELIKVVLRPGVRTALLHNPEQASLHESADRAYPELTTAKLRPARTNAQTPILIKRESKDKKAGLTSLNYGFRDAGLATLVPYITSIDIVGDAERTLIADPKKKWTELYD
jgi:hypothetical protein